MPIVPPTPPAPPHVCVVGLRLGGPFSPFFLCATCGRLRGPGFR